MCQKYQPSPSGFFANSSKMVIHGGHFTVNQNLIKGGKIFIRTQIWYDTQTYLDDVGFELLQNYVSTAAIHNALQKNAQLTCHPCTRGSVLSDIFKWINTAERDTWLLWMKGPAGAGKTTIARSLVKLCEEKRIPIVTYFFHSDTARNTIATVASTIAYQMIQLIPETKPLITQTIHSNPLIFDQSFESQLEMLVIKPLQQIHGNSPSVSWKLLLVMDGLEQCTDGKDSQVFLIHAVAKYLATQSPLIIILISSREERHLTMAFNATTVDNILLRLTLDERYATYRDIRVYLQDRFNEIRATHPCRDLIDGNWPTSSDIESILSESSDQFIYAAVVLNFVSCPYSHPPDQLKIILESQSNQYGPSTPFEELDRLYFHIFSQVDENTMHLAVRILEYVVLEKVSSVSSISSSLSVSTPAIYTALAGLASIIEFRDGQIIFLHASLSNFLLNRSRSKQYCVIPVDNRSMNLLKRCRSESGSDLKAQNSTKKQKSDSSHTGESALR